MSAAMGLHFLRGQGAPFLEHDLGPDGLSENCIRYADHAYFEHPIQRIDQVFHLYRADLFSTTLDKFIRPRDKMEIAVIVHGEEVLCAKHLLPRVLSRG